MEKEVFVKDWIPYSEAGDSLVSLGGFGGWFKDGIDGKIT